MAARHDANRAQKRRFKSASYAAMARIPAALANPHRLELIDLIGQRPRTVQDAANELGLSVANASQHLRVLASAGLIEVRRTGTFAYYRARDPLLFGLLAEIRAMAGAAASQVPRPFTDETPPIRGVDAVRSLLTGRRTALLDVRPAEEFDAGHLPGAISVPLEHLSGSVDRLAKSKRYLVYCRGPYCVFADEAVAMLREHGFRATRVAVGPMEWVAAGCEVIRAN